MKKVILLLCVFALICVGMVMGLECNTNLDNMPCNLTINTPTLDASLDVHCPNEDCFGINESGTYDLNGAIIRGNDTDGDGAIIIGANDVTLDCNGASLVGNLSGTSYAIHALNYNNITVKNCNVKSYYNGMYIRNTDNSFFINNSINSTTNRAMNIIITVFNITIENNYFFNNSFSIYMDTTSNASTIRGNTIINSTDTAITINGLSNNLIENNRIEYITSTSVIRGILLSGTGGNSKITNNKVIGYKYGIQVGANNPNTNITFNNITDANLWGISTTANYTIIANNRIFNDYWNSIYYQGWYNIIDSNYIENFKHYGIDHHDDNDLITARYNNITNNNITQTDLEFSGACMLHGQTFESYVFNNRCFNIVNSTITNTDSGLGITSEGNQTFGNRFINNTFSNITGWCAREGSNNNTWEGNTFDNCTFGEFRIRTLSKYQSSQFLNPILINNIYSNGIANINFSISTDNTNTSVNETSAIRHNVELHNNGLIKFSYNGRKDLRVENNTITINNMPTAFNQIFNQTSTTPTAENVNTFTETIPANNRSFVFSYLTAFQPKFTSIPITVTNMDYDYNSTSKILILVCTGTGSTTLTNMNSIKGDDGYYDIYHNGVKLTKSNTNDYTMSSCSTWIFGSSDTAVKSTMDDMIEQLKKVIPWIGLILIVALASIILLIVKGEIEPEDGMKGITALLLAVIAIAIILTVSIMLLTELGAV